MTIRLRLFLLLGGVLAAVLLAQWMLGQRLVRDVGAQLSETAFSVGQSVVTAIVASGAAGNAMMRLELDDASPDAHALRVEAGGATREVPIPRKGVSSAIGQFRSRLLAGSLALFAAGLVVAGLVAHRVTAPLRSLAAAARAIAEGRSGVQVATAAGGEIGDTIRAFNGMSARLHVLEQERAAMRDRERLGELGLMARGLAHGLRSPLNALGLGLEEMAHSGKPEPELAASARRQITRIDEALRAFLALAAVEDQAEVQPVDVAAVAREVAREVEHDARDRVTIHVTAAADLPPLHGLAVELRAAIHALVVNAAEAAPEGTRVEVAVERGAGGETILHVDDAGPGLGPAIRERLFQPHVTSKASGAGMGLYVAHRIATGRHRGGVEIASRADGGTRATLRLHDASPAHA